MPRSPAKKECPRQRAQRTGRDTCGRSPGLRSLLLEAEEAQRDQETDQTVAEQTQDVWQDTQEVFAVDHNIVQSLHRPGGNTNLGNALHPAWLKPQWPPRATYGRGEQRDQRDNRGQLAACL